MQKKIEQADAQIYMYFFTRDSTAALTAQLDPQDSTHDCDARLATSRLQASGTT